MRIINDKPLTGDIWDSSRLKSLIINSQILPTYHTEGSLAWVPYDSSKSWLVTDQHAHFSWDTTAVVHNMIYPHSDVARTGGFCGESFDMVIPYQWPNEHHPTGSYLRFVVDATTHMFGIRVEGDIALQERRDNRTIGTYRSQRPAFTTVVSRSDQCLQTWQHNDWLITAFVETARLETMHTYKRYDSETVSLSVKHGKIDSGVMNGEEWDVLCPGLELNRGGDQLPFDASELMMISTVLQG